MVASACVSRRGPNITTVDESALAPALRAGTHEIQLNGVRQYFRVAGLAHVGVPPVVFLHGGPGQGSAHFDGLVGPTIEQRLRVVYYDQRGSGLSERPASNDYAIATLVEDVEALRRELGAPKIALIGHSFGGLLALEYGAKYPDRVSHLVFVDGLYDTKYQCHVRVQRLAELRPAEYARVRGDTLAPDGTRRSDCEMEFRALRGAERELFNTRMMFPDPAVAVRMDSVNATRNVRNTGEMSRALFAAGLLQYQFSAYDRLTMPVLVIAGRHDGAAGPEGQRELLRRLPKATYLEFEHSGHFPYLDERERFVREVAAFITR
jgi:proline iminopeptidase